jgi:ribosomal protein S18 acetylase RimI-like enzyme
MARALLPPTGGRGGAAAVAKSAAAAAPATAEISRVVASARLRRVGLGSAVVRHAEHFAKACGYKRVFLSTLATMRGANELYAGRLGYAALAPAGGVATEALGLSVSVCYYERAL